MLIVDTREKKNQHVLKSFDTLHVAYKSKKLDVGDYMFEGGNISVDKKYGMQEVYSCLIQQYPRFRRELIRAKEAGIQLVILTEEAHIKSIAEVVNWKNPRREKWLKANRERMNGGRQCSLPPAPPIASKDIMRKMKMLTEVYGVIWAFCKKRETGITILNILNAGLVKLDANKEKDTGTETSS